MKDDISRTAFTKRKELIRPVEQPNKLKIKIIFFVG